MTSHIAVESRSIAPVLPASARLRVEPRSDARAERTDAAVDEALSESFPASDPPAWNQGMTRPGPAFRGTSGVNVAEKGRDRGEALRERDDSRPPPRERTVVKAFTSQAGALGLVLLVPLAVLAVGLPIVLLLRGVLEAVTWLLR